MNLTNILISFIQFFFHTCKLDFQKVKFFLSQIILVSKPHIFLIKPLSVHYNFIRLKSVQSKSITFSMKKILVQTPFFVGRKRPHIHFPFRHNHKSLTLFTSKRLLNLNFSLLFALMISRTAYIRNSNYWITRHNLLSIQIK